jgi:hypothetical protein
VAVAWIRRSFLFGDEGNWTCGDFWLVGRVGSMKNYGRMILLPLVLRPVCLLESSFLLESEFREK